MSAKFELTAERRAQKGTGASRRLRRAGRVPAVMYGAGKEPAMVTLDHATLYRHLQDEKFMTSILTVKLDGDADQAILRDVHMHPYKPRVLHLDLQRISATEKIHIKVPLHFLGADVAPGVKQQGGVISHLVSDVDVSCLPKDLPEYLEVDLSNLALNQSLHLNDIKVPAGVTVNELAHGNNLAVASCTVVRAVVEVEEVAAAPAEGEAAAAGEAAPAAAAGGTAPAAPAAGKAAPAAGKKEGAPAPKKEGK